MNNRLTLTVSTSFSRETGFFLENAGQFTVGSPGEVDLFFSRRIGIGNDGELVPIIGVEESPGKLGRPMWAYSIWSPKLWKRKTSRETTFRLLQVNHNFSNSRSSLGGIFVGKNELGDASDAYNRVLQSMEN